MSETIWARVHQSPPVIVTAPTIEPITVAEAKTQCRVDISDDDTYFQDLLIPSARWQVEHQTSRALINTVFDVTLDRFPPGRVLPLPRWPLVSVTSITSYDKDDVATTLAASKYLVDTANEPGRVILQEDANWPSDLRNYAAGVIRFTAGYGTTAAAVTSRALWARHAMLYLIAWWYARREPVVVGNLTTPLPWTFESLIAPGRQYAMA